MNAAGRVLLIRRRYDLCPGQPQDCRTVHWLRGCLSSRSGFAALRCESVGVTLRASLPASSGPVFGGVLSAISRRCLVACAIADVRLPIRSISTNRETSPHFLHCHPALPYPEPVFPFRNPKAATLRRRTVLFSVNATSCLRST